MEVYLLRLSQIIVEISGECPEQVGRPVQHGDQGFSLCRPIVDRTDPIGAAAQRLFEGVQHLSRSQLNVKSLGSAYQAFVTKPFQF